MKDGRTHLAYKAEHAVDLETGAIIGVTVQDADEGDTTTSRETLIYAAEQIEAVCPDGDGLQEVVGDKGYHSNQSLVDLEAVGVRGYIAEPDRGRRNWTKNLRGHTNIRKRLLIHTAGFNLGVLMRKLIGVGTPRGLQGRLIAIMTALLPLLHAVWKLLTGRERSVRHVHELNAMPAPNPPPSP